MDDKVFLYEVPVFSLTVGVMLGFLFGDFDIMQYVVYEVWIMGFSAFGILMSCWGFSNIFRSARLYGIYVKDEYNGVSNVSSENLLESIFKQSLSIKKQLAVVLFSFILCEIIIFIFAPICFSSFSFFLSEIILSLTMLLYTLNVVFHVNLSLNVRLLTRNKTEVLNE